MDQPNKAFEEWQLQADYDLETAESLLKSGRFVYVVFFCHLSLEKMLKALWTKKFKNVPLKTHSLIFLKDRLEIIFPDEKAGKFVSYLNSLSVPTRYPDTLRALTKEFNFEKPSNILAQTKETLQWLKQM